ncbi:MAG: hypothetical protein PHW24_01335 [Candidatus Moranbacteria bacterium]|nr:hypothetical protein [Candidatus Moranbacteria bacterium]
MEFLKKVYKNKYLKFFLIAAFFSLLVVSRRVDVVTYPQFYAEDGVFWFSEAYGADHFWQPFLIPKQGYFQTVSRVGGLLGNMVGIGRAPLVFNVFAILFQILPALYFLSARFGKLVPKLWQRFLCSLAYLSLLGTAEINANLTNVQWRLALLMFLIIIVPKSKKISWRIFDWALLFLAGLSGPFIFFALPIAIIYFYKNLFKEFLDKFAILAVTFLIQLYSYLFIVNDAARSTAPLGASFVNFFKILSGDVFVRSLLGTDYVKKIIELGLWENGSLPISFGVAGVAVLGYVFWKAQMELKLFIIFAFLVFAGALSSPQVSLIKPQWDVMTGGPGGRYYFLPGLAWMISLGWLFFNSEKRFLKTFVGILLACFVFIGLPHDWVFAKYKDYHFNQQIHEFKSVKVGDQYKFRIVPKWDMYLKKK